MLVGFSLLWQESVLFALSLNLYLKYVYIHNPEYTQNMLCL
jgi:hypothetical protein